MINLFKKKEKATVTLTDDNWDKIINSSSGPVVVDIWASWCGPCKLIGPIVDELAEEFKGKVTVGKLNSEENNKSRELGIRSIPTLLFYKDGKRVNQIVGAKPMDIIRQQMERLAS
mgnify:CR=1 FL=1